MPSAPIRDEPTSALTESTLLLLERLTAERKVRAVAEVMSSAPTWAGSRPALLVFERGLSDAKQTTQNGVQLWQFPYEKLEDWADLYRAEAPLEWLANGKAVYDPSGNLAKLGRQLRQASAPQLSAARTALLDQAAAELSAAGEWLRRGSGIAGQLLALTETRRIATRRLYPALLTHLHLWPASWPDGGVRLPHHWRAQAGLAFPRAVYHLDQLYGFGGADEARRVLLATRGLNLVQTEKRAKLAQQAGYFDGAVRFVRDEAALLWRSDLERWNHLSSARQAKLSTVLGAGLSPLGPVALEIGRELIEDVRAGR
ncbi:hypothetical protein EHF33_05240 [Deinococcus psychrotolerans]|uniref:Uncharacterized protein n=1 Tax=Deinococcus psychrotolerans TaxID=2489213 RepID=A0A3G8YM52_9DEIO|nr:hypothetical protein [Deinococcus psychrotolerans]AZI42226.1 hypothetical protein EHF33_05240 [Deinococcus psychrotolerans]